MRRYLTEGAAKLTPSELDKLISQGSNAGQHRIDFFVSKWERGDSFTLMTGLSVVLKKNKKNINLLKQWKELLNKQEEYNINRQVVPNDIGNKITDIKKEISKVGFFEDVDGNKYKLSDFMKDVSFGGKGATKEAGIKHEDIAIDDINRRIKELRKQFNITAIPLLVPASKSSDLYYITKVVHTGNTNKAKPPSYCAQDIKRRNQPKSDFHFVDEYGNDCVWISYKQGSKSGTELADAKIFQQYGSAGCFKANPEIVNFVKDVMDAMLEIYGDSLINRKGEFMYPEKAPSYYRKIKDKLLKLQAVYGVDYPGPLGHDNVTFVCSGKIWVELILDEEGYPVFMLNAQNIHENGEVLKGVWEPVLFLRRAAGDSVKDQKGNILMRDARIFIQPIARFKELSKRATKTVKI